MEKRKFLKKRKKEKSREKQRISLFMILRRHFTIVCLCLGVCDAQIVELFSQLSDSPATVAWLSSCLYSVMQTDSLDMQTETESNALMSNGPPLNASSDFSETSNASSVSRLDFFQIFIFMAVYVKFSSLLCG